MSHRQGVVSQGVEVSLEGAEGQCFWPRPCGLPQLAGGRAVAVRCSSPRQPYQVHPLLCPLCWRPARNLEFVYMTSCQCGIWCHLLFRALAD